ncbi:MAG: GntR family transcriptional regulator [Fervidobacterium sp.]|uniref:GntR family transcriptional regulator n=1 Tax=Fervidobacterium sp. TaxID=1871331 RepID=UPI0040496189
MWFAIDFHSHVPVYVQIKDNIKKLIVSGKFKENDFLPSIRVLSKDIGVNVNTVARAYRELEAEGIIKSERGEGYIVVGVHSEKLKSEKLSELEKMLRKCRDIGITMQEVIDILNTVYEVSMESKEGGEDGEVRK